MNKCTLLIDGNWLLQSRVFTIIEGFEKHLSTDIKQETTNKLKENMIKSINIILNRFPVIDNIILITDGGSWRKQIPIPSILGEGVRYKGNRGVGETEIDWNYIYKALNTLSDRCKDLGLTVCNYNNIEGDDWIWYWTKYLNSCGVDCIIWSSDNDLKQLIKKDSTTGALTVWYNDRNGLWVDKSLDYEQDDIDFFLEPSRSSSIIESLNQKIGGDKMINYINPQDIILGKIICGDIGDNIKSIVRYKKGERVYGIGNKMWDRIRKTLEINDIDVLISKKEQLVSAIIKDKKFKSAKLSQSDITEMIDYNIRLVWLDERVIPESLIQVMTQQEYKLYDINLIRTNYNILLEEDEDIISLFESI